MRPIHNAWLAKSKQLISSEKSSAQTSTKSAQNGHSAHREKQMKLAQFSFICAETRHRGFKLHRDFNKLRLAPSRKPILSCGNRGTPAMASIPQPLNVKFGF
jgi:hypothetical protein